MTALQFERWTVHRDGGAFSERAAECRPYAVRDADGNLVCTLADVPEREGERLARLIAAAPLLLAQCRETVEVYRVLPKIGAGGTPCFNRPDAPDPCPCSACVVQRTIEAATGERP